MMTLLSMTKCQTRLHSDHDQSIPRIGRRSARIRIYTTFKRRDKANHPYPTSFIAMKSILLFTLVTGSTAFLFPVPAGGGGGCGADTSCFPTLPTFQLPRLQCQRLCFSVPTIAIPPPPPLPALPSPCGCGKRKKRSVNVRRAGDEKCTDLELRKLILNAVSSNVTESRNNIVTALKDKHGSETGYLVSCAQGEVVFQSSADEFCSDGTQQLTCHVARVD